MDWQTILGWALAVVASAAAVYVWITKGKSDSEDYWAELAEASRVAHDIVQAAQQLWEEGKIPTTAGGEKDPRFVWAYNELRKIFPELSEDVLTMTIEAAVYWLKHIATHVGEQIQAAQDKPK